jgi:DNA-binding NarL/FixJ family response regulator
MLKDGTHSLASLFKARVGELDELVHALREVSAGRSLVDSGVVERLVDYRSRQAESPVRLLSEREVEVLREMAEGKSNSSIASGLHLSESSVEKYVNTIFSKLGLSEERLLSHQKVSYLRAATTPHKQVLGWGSHLPWLECRAS